MAEENNQELIAVYVLGLTAIELQRDVFQGIALQAAKTLMGRQTEFASMMQRVGEENVPMLFAHIHYGPNMHDLDTMQAVMTGWMKKQYALEVEPELNSNYFVEMVSLTPGDSPEAVLFYFDTTSLSVID